MFKSKARSKFLFLFFLSFLFLFLAIVFFKGDIFAQLGLIAVFFLIFLFITFNFQSGFFVLVILRVALDFFRERKIIEEPFFLNLGGGLGDFCSYSWALLVFKKKERNFKDPPLLDYFFIFNYGFN